MTTRLSIGDFSRMTYLSVKALRHYHDVGVIVRAPDARSRDAALVGHLRRMEQQLQDTQQTVRSLRSLLEEPRDEARVQRRHIPATTALMVAERVAADSVVAWWMDAFTLLHRALADSGATRSGPDGALFPREFFEDEIGDLVAVLPVASEPAETAF